MKASRSTLVTAAILAVLALLFTACQVAPTPTPTSPSATPTTAPAVAAATPIPVAKRAPKGKVVMVLSSEPATMDTLMVSMEPHNVWFPSVIEHLVERDWKTFEIKPKLAEKWEQVKPDTWRYTLRKGVKFQNGEPFNADAVAYDLTRIADKDAASRLQKFWPAGGKATKVDDNTIDVTSSTADPIQPLRMQYMRITAPKW